MGRKHIFLDQNEILINVSQACEFLGISPTTFYRWKKNGVFNGKLDFVRFGSTVRVNLKQVKQFIENNKHIC